MKRKPIAALLACLFVIATAGDAQRLDQEMPALADQISKALFSKGYKNVAAVDFTDIQGQPTELGRFLADQLTVEIVLTSSVSMVDRANIKNILAEHKLTEEGLVNPENAKKLGEFAGVDAILIGNVTALDDGIVLTVKAISTATAQIAAAGRIKFSKTGEIQQLSNRSVSGNAGNSGSPAVSAGERAGTNYQDSTAIATKDIGSLRVVLKSVLPLKLKDQNGRNVNGIRCSFEFMSRETQKSIVVAANAVPLNQIPGRISADVVVLRSGLLDDRGGVWALPASALTGLAFIRAGVHGRDPPQSYSATEIPRLLDLRDKLGRDQDDPSDGARSVRPQGYPYAFDTSFQAFPGNRFISGSTTMIGPGEIVRLTMDFVADGDGGTAPKFIQINSEIVVGVLTSAAKISYSLQNLTFDRVGMPVF